MGPDTSTRFPLEPLVQGHDHLRHLRVYLFNLSLSEANYYSIRFIKHKENFAYLLNLQLTQPLMSTSSHIESKAKLRISLKDIRLSICKQKRNYTARRFALLATKLAIFKRAQHIGVYLNTGSEAPTKPLIQLCHALNKKVYAPIITDYKSKKMAFAPLQRVSRLPLNRWKISEPTVNKRNLVNSQVLDILFLPLLGFDTLGNRIGMGAGFYDRELSKTSRQNRVKSPTLVGLGFNAQQLPNIPSDPWDIPLDYIITETGITRINQ